MNTRSENQKNEAGAPAFAARMDPLATLPVFFKLSGKRVIVAGGSEPALWKSELLAAAGANVDVYSDHFASGFTDLSNADLKGHVALNHRRWQPPDLGGAAIAIGAMTDDRDAEDFAEACRSAGVPVNVIDRPAFCDFQFGAIVNRSPLVVAISTDGGAPVFGQAIRSLVESLLPEGFRRWAEAAKAWRRDPGLDATSTAQKRSFWTRFADLAMREPNRVPTSEDRVALLEGASEAATVGAGAVTVIQVGADAETLTLRAVRALRAADLVLFEDGIPHAALDFARRESERHRLPTPASYSALVKLVAENAGRRVVCLVQNRHPKPASLSGDHPLVVAIRAAGSAVETI